MFSMSYEDIITIIFVAVQVVKKEVIVHRPKTPPKQRLDGDTLDMNCAGVGHPPVESKLAALLGVMFASFCFWVSQRFTAAITSLFHNRL
jgi:hypothetical protein